MTEPYQRREPADHEVLVLTTHRYANCQQELASFYCPGCKHNHAYRVAGPEQGPVWEWNKSFDKPTFTPSLLNRKPDGDVCHLFVCDGRIDFCGDCTHELKGRSVPMVPYKEWP